MFVSLLEVCGIVLTKKDKYSEVNQTKLFYIMEYWKGPAMWDK